MFDIEILHNKDCHTWKLLRSELRRWLRMWGLQKTIKPRITLIETGEQARERRFAGSPQLMLNGRDVDPLADRIKAYRAGGCRVYIWNGKVYEYPPKEMVENAILELNSICKPERRKRPKKRQK